MNCFPVIFGMVRSTVANFSAELTELGARTHLVANRASIFWNFRLHFLEAQSTDLGCTDHISYAVTFAVFGSMHESIE